MLLLVMKSLHVIVGTKFDWRNVCGGNFVTFNPLSVTLKTTNQVRVPKLISLLIQIIIFEKLTMLTSFVQSSSPWKQAKDQPSNVERDFMQWTSSNHTTYILDPDKANATSRPSLAAQQPISLQDVDDDEEEPLGLAEGDEEDEDEDEEDDDEFYSSNPVDSMSISLKKFDDFDDFEALGLKNFYGNTAKGEGEVRSKEPTQRAQQKRKLRKGKRPRRTRAQRRRRKRKRLELNHARVNNSNEQQQVPNSETKPSNRAATNSDQTAVRSMAASNEQGQQQAGTSSFGVNQCAMISAAGVCIDFQTVEWALSEARRLIAFRRPGGLNSLEPSESTVNAIGELTEWTSRLLAMRFGLTSNEVAESMGQIDVSQTSLWRVCPRLFRSPWSRQCYGRLSQQGQPLYYQLDLNQMVLTSGRYRSITGQCNNPLVPNLGSTFMPFVRLNTPEYGDGVGSARRPQAGGLAELPPARLVALTLHSDPVDGVPSSDLSALFAAWGQLINHDLALASGARLATGHEGSCCKNNAESRRVSSPLGRVCMPIAIGPMDPVYGPFGQRCHDFKRSIAGLRPGCSLGPRTQLNLVTSFVDGSFVYGSTRSQANSLRSPNGQLAVWNYFERAAQESDDEDGARRRRRRRRQAQEDSVQLKPLLPPQQDEPDDECLGRPQGLFCFRSGDFRTNQQVPLAALHTIHVRQHNRLAQALRRLNPHWTSERIYQEARHIHIAQIQHVVMREYLPLLLGAGTRLRFNLLEADEGQYWDHYEPNLNPGIGQEFAAAAFRQGHSTVASEVFRVDVASRLPRRLYKLRELFRQPWPLFEPGAMDEFLLGLTETASRELDPFVSRELSGHLLQEPQEPVGLDLVAINIQRGRDQGVASYNSMRDWCGLARLETFDDLVAAVGNQSAQLMMQLYATLDDIDLYSGGLSEFPLETAGLLGPTFSCIVGHQFSLLRQGDRYWYESSGGPHAFTPQQLASIKQTTLARILCANSDRIWAMQPMAMRLPHPIYNPPISCQELPELDLSLWLESASQQRQQSAEAGPGEPDSE